MAKSKKSRRDRRLETEKRQQTSSEVAYAASSAFSSVPKATLDGSKSSQSDTKTIDLGTEYYYVYTEIRNILAISVVMFAILFGLGFLI
ncbi:hypothetical protein QUF58_00540 [Anaerolineales bacterium HSG24]|nr:hypothetical protein [Anaerolineales bacterium HSG24]